MRLIPVLLPSLATALVAPARPLTVTPARLAPLQAGAVADAEKLKVAPKLESPPVDSSGTLPKVNGGIVIGTRKLAVVTGASSGLGLYGALSLAKRGDYYVVLACRNVERAERVAKEMGFPANSYTVIKCELGSFKSVRDFVFNLRAFKGPRGLRCSGLQRGRLPAGPRRGVFSDLERVRLDAVFMIIRESTRLARAPRQVRVNRRTPTKGITKPPRRRTPNPDSRRTATRCPWA